MEIAGRIALSLLIAIGVAALVWSLSRHHVFVFPFVLILGPPLWWIWSPRTRHDIEK